MSFIRLVLPAAFPRLVFVDAVGKQGVADSPGIAVPALPGAVEEERQQLQFERRTAFRTQRFCQQFDFTAAEVERAKVVRRHAHHYQLFAGDSDAFNNQMAHSDKKLRAPRPFGRSAG